MESIECKNCGSSALELVGNEYVCQACGSRFQASELFSTPQSESTAQLTEEKKAELKRLKANLKDDHSLHKRILELDPYDWEAYFYAHGADNDKWLVCLRQSGLSVKEIESILNTYYYEEKKRMAVTSYLENSNMYRHALDVDHHYKLALESLLNFKKSLNSRGIHIISILGEDYSALVQNWESDWDNTCRRYTKELTDKRDRIVRAYYEEKKNLRKSGWLMVIAGSVLSVIGLILTFYFYSILALSLGLGVGVLVIFIGEHKIEYAKDMPSPEKYYD